ncbi:hypothetical protein QBC37DRAFT_368168 [Rhypophila decipiens]|uniref:Integral membrane protein n=1 Tax=Rhypophila decipiens TaxID=261697 RepID=A0AAN6YJF4_9PEZI|nr:hypothetical protein QBC37DRAFT_368168 [Rhypophila decipiens]
MGRPAQSHFRGSHYRALHSSGPLRFLNPTTRYHLISKVPGKAGGARVVSRPKQLQPETVGAVQEASTKTEGGVYEEPGPVPPEKSKPSPPPPPTPNKVVYHVWRSRDNRKGRHAAVVVAAARKEEEKEVGKVMTVLPSATNTLAETCKGIVKMAVRWPVWDVSFDVAVVFTIGSVIWVINGSFVWLPLVAPWTEFPDEVSLGGGVTAFIGATVFEIGSVLFMLEAVNENRSDCFGWALEESLENHGQRLRTDDDHCRHHHHEKRGLLHAAGPSLTSLSSSSGKEKETPDSVVDKATAPKPHNDDNEARNQKEKTTQRRGWSWWPTRHELTSHYLRDIGFLACLAQMIGATVFWIAGFTGLPPIYDALMGYGPGAVNGIYWLPQVVGGTGFIVSSALFMLEVQDKWWKPALGMLGWHIGAWNLVGAIGFTLCGALGFGSGNSASLEYASVLATYVGSWAFLIGSIIQWYESLDKYPISVGAVPPSLRDDHGTP